MALAAELFLFYYKTIRFKQNHLYKGFPLEGKLSPQAADEVERQKTALNSNYERADDIRPTY